LGLASAVAAATDIAATKMAATANGRDFVEEVMRWSTAVMALSFAEPRVPPTAAPSCVASVSLLPKSSKLLVCQRKLLISNLSISCQMAVSKHASDRNPHWPTHLLVLDVARH
jgi:hypothetical protein